jgi:hypothetical protein
MDGQARAAGITELTNWVTEQVKDRMFDAKHCSLHSGFQNEIRVLELCDSLPGSVRLQLMLLLTV